MTKGPIKNMAASVRQRLTNVAKAADRRFSDVLQYYALERWLFRLSESQHRDRFILKGALLFVAWKAPATRPTRDIDLLGRLHNDLESIRVVARNGTKRKTKADRKPSESPRPRRNPCVISARSTTLKMGRMRADPSTLTGLE